MHRTDIESLCNISFSFYEKISLYLEFYELFGSNMDWKE